jgi:hypothetical protein
LFGVIFFMTTAGEFLKFARSTVWSYRALASWVRRRGRKGISVAKALPRRKRLDAKARVVLQIRDLRDELLAAQRELSDALVQRKQVGRMFFGGSTSLNGNGKS